MSDTGGGHRAAAEAIRAAILSRHEADIQMVDVFRNYSPFPFKYMPEFYPWLIAHSKSSWGVGYKLSNTKRRAHTSARMMYVTMESRLKRMLREHPADVVVCVHSVLTRVSLQAMLRQERRPPFIVVVTDLVSTHYFWYDRRADLTLVPTQPAYERGLVAGIPPHKMQLTGLPVHPNFIKNLPEKADARALDARRLGCQIAVVAGKNSALRQQLESSTWHQPTHIYPFVKDMPRLMAAADILVTKAGPSTICEACIAGLPMVLYDAIPGQEEGNVDFVVDHQAGVFAPSAEQVADAVQTWLRNDGALMRQKAANARAIAYPNAIWEIADRIWEHAQQPPILRSKRSILREMRAVVGTPPPRIKLKKRLW
jgi:1,2-diacylglycerol 3-beta-galactosyltransferase